MKRPTFIKWNSPFSSSGLKGVAFHSYSNFNITNNREPDQTLQSVASDLGLYYLSMSHKKNASLIWVNTFVVYVTHISCTVSS